MREHLDDEEVPWPWPERPAEIGQMGGVDGIPVVVGGSGIEPEEETLLALGPATVNLGGPEAGIDRAETGDVGLPGERPPEHAEVGPGRKRAPEVAHEYEVFRVQEPPGRHGDSPPDPQPPGHVDEALAQSGHAPIVARRPGGRMPSRRPGNRPVTPPTEADLAIRLARDPGLPL